MSTDFLPVSRKDMEERGIEQLDFVYVIGDAYVDHPSFGHAITVGFWRHMASGWGSFHSPTGRIKRVFPF